MYFTLTCDHPAMFSQPWTVTQCSGFFVYSPSGATNIPPSTCGVRICTTNVAPFGFIPASQLPVVPVAAAPNTFPLNPPQQPISTSGEPSPPAPVPPASLPSNGGAEGTSIAVIAAGSAGCGVAALLLVAVAYYLRCACRKPVAGADPLRSVEPARPNAYKVVVSGLSATAQPRELGPQDLPPSRRLREVSGDGGRGQPLAEGGRRRADTILDIAAAGGIKRAAQAAADDNTHHLSADLVALLCRTQLSAYGPTLQDRLGVRTLQHALLLAAQGKAKLLTQLEGEAGLKKAEALTLAHALTEEAAKAAAAVEASKVSRAPRRPAAALASISCAGAHVAPFAPCVAGGVAASPRACFGGWLRLL